MALGAAAGRLRVAVSEPARATVAVASISTALVGAMAAAVIVAVPLTLTLVGAVISRRNVAVWL